VEAHSNDSRMAGILQQGTPPLLIGLPESANVSGCRLYSPPLTANFLERFFRSAATRGTRVATPTLQSRYKNGLTSGDTEWYKKLTRLMYTKEGA